MRILLDESVPGRLGSLLIGHQSVTVQERGWAGVKNGRLLLLASPEFDVFLTADRGIEFQQNLASLPIAVEVVISKTNRMADMALHVPAILQAMQTIQPRTLNRVGG